MMTDSTTSTGIMSLETRSTPLRTPAKMMPSVKSANSRKQTSADAPSAMNALK